jgi:hypothetical protein
MTELQPGEFDDRRPDRLTPDVEARTGSPDPAFLTAGSAATPDDCATPPADSAATPGKQARVPARRAWIPAGSRLGKFMF